MWEPVYSGSEQQNNINRKLRMYILGCVEYYRRGVAVEITRLKLLLALCPAAIFCLIIFLSQIFCYFTKTATGHLSFSAHKLGPRIFFIWYTFILRFDKYRD